MMPLPTVVCPFCPLHCDDLQVDESGNTGVNCDRAAKGFRLVASRSQRDCGLDLPVVPAVPLVEIMNASIEEAKEIQALVQASAIRLHPGQNTTSQAFSTTATRDGYVAATFSEILAHSDFIWVIGDPSESTPRLMEKLGESNATIRQDATLTSQVLSELLAMESGSSEGKSGSTASKVHLAASTSRYTTVVIGDNAFQAGCDWIAAESIGRLISDWNVPSTDDPMNSGRRAVLFRLSENESLKNVFRWRTNELPFVDLQSDVEQVPDIRLGWNPTSKANITLQIGGHDPGEGLATHYASAALPGIHFRGTVIRGDGSVSLPLDAPIKSDGPKRMDVLRRLIT